MALLTDRGCQTAQPKKMTAADGSTRLADNWLTDGGARGAGRLYLRVQPGRRRGFYYRCTGPNGERQAIPLGEFGRGPGLLTLSEARERAGVLSDLVRSGVRDLRAHLQAEQDAREREQRAAAEADAAALADAERGTLAKLIYGYIQGLQRAGKFDWKDAQGVLRLHVVEAFPELAARKAAEIHARDLRPVLARLVDEGKGRTAGKLRSYLHAAYRAGMAADYDPEAPQSLCGFAIEANPCASLPSMARFNRAGDRVLTEQELHHYLAALDEQTTMTRLALELHIQLAGQRPTQLARVQAADVDTSQSVGEIVMRDPKGARLAPRLHRLPLIGRARAVVKELLVINPTGPLLSNGPQAPGKPSVPIQLDTLSAAVASVSDDLLKRGLVRSPFRLSDIRRTCETQLAALGVSKDTRGQLLSHGLGGVQDRNYDRHGYEREKLAALKAWAAHLERVRSGTPAAGGNVVRLRARERI